MKTNFKHLAILSFVAFLLLGFQYTANAQAQIFNNTNCDFYLKVEQSNLSPNSPDFYSCSSCNSSGTVMIPAGGTYTHPYDPSCGPEQWLGLKWYTGSTVVWPTLLSSYGISYNPFLNCGQNVQGSCNGSPIDVNWLSFGPSGQVLIFLQ